MLVSALDALLACAVADLDPVPGRVLINPGLEVPWDDCCAGQAWVRLVSLIPSGNPFPQVDMVQGGAGCGVTLWAATIGVGVLRCAAVVDDQGNAPSVAAMTADAVQQIVDMRSLEQAITCCFKGQGYTIKVLGWDPLGVNGGCVGGEWTIMLAVNSCGCP